MRRVKLLVGGGSEVVKDGDEGTINKERENRFHHFVLDTFIVSCHLLPACSALHREVQGWRGPLRGEKQGIASPARARRPASPAISHQRRDGAPSGQPSGFSVVSRCGMTQYEGSRRMWHY